MAKGDMQPVNGLAGSPFRSNMMGPPQAPGMGSIGGSFTSQNLPGMQPGQSGQPSMGQQSIVPFNKPGPNYDPNSTAGPTPEAYQQLMQMLGGGGRGFGPMMGGMLNRMNRMPPFRGMMPQGFDPNYHPQTPTNAPSGNMGTPRNRERNA